MFKELINKFKLMWHYYVLKRTLLISYVGNPFYWQASLYNQGSAGYDIRLRTNRELKKLIQIKRNNKVQFEVIINTGLRCIIPKGYVGFLLPRSKMVKDAYFINQKNTVGVIDSDFRGPLKIFCNLISQENIDDFIIYDTYENYFTELVNSFQLVIVKANLNHEVLFNTNIIDLFPTKRNDKGYGST